MLLSQILSINKFLAAGIIALLTIFYTSLGGSRADVISDVFQGIAILTVIIVAAFLLYSSNSFEVIKDNLNNNPNDLLNVNNQGILFILAMVILPFFAIHTDPSLQLRLYMAQDDKEATKGSYLAAGIYLIFGVSLIALVLGINALGLGKGDNILIEYALNNKFQFITIGFIIAIYSAVVSTMDSQAIKISSIITHDLYIRLSVKVYDDKDKGKQTKLLLGWIIMLGFAFSLILFHVESAFFFLSSVWVIGISSFGLLFMGFRIPALRNTMKRANVLNFDLIASSLIVIIVIIYLVATSKNNPSNILYGLGTALVFLKLIIYFVLMFIYHIKKRRNEKS